MNDTTRFDDLLSELTHNYSHHTWRNLATMSNSTLNDIFDKLLGIDCTGVSESIKKHIHGLLIMSLDQSNKKHFEAMENWGKKWETS